MIDLHLHSSYSSDGEIEPRDLVIMARGLNLRAVALADHDTVAGIAAFLAAGEEFAVETVPAIEITTSYEGRFTHVLGYFIDHTAPCLGTYIVGLEEARLKQAAGRIAKLRGLGISVLDERVAHYARGYPPVGPVIAMAVLENPANRDIGLLRPYFEGGEYADRPFFYFDREILADDKIAGFPVRRPSLFEAVDVIRDSGGLAVFAHPGDKYRLPEDRGIFIELAEYGLSGMEVYCSYHGDAEVKAFGALADELDLIKTAGSDFHGPKVKPHVKMGDISYNDYSIVEALRAQLGNG